MAKIRHEVFNNHLDAYSRLSSKYIWNMRQIDRIKSELEMLFQQIELGNAQRNRERLRSVLQILDDVK